MDFKLYTGTLKAYETKDGDRFVSGTTSSTIRDLHGDAMAMSALKSMEETAKQNMTVFLNHNYNVPEDLFGSAVDARIVKRMDAESGEEVYDLDIDVKVCPEDENPQAMQAYRAIKRGVKLGLSIGARVEAADKQRDETSGVDTYIINKVRLLEASVVGLPANQRSYLHNAVKSLRQAQKSDEIGISDSEFLDDDIYEKKNPAAPARDQREGSSSNAPGSASGQSGRISLSSATRKALQNKANEHNSAMKEKGRPSWTRVRVGALRSVYRRGSGAYSTSHRPGIGRAQWSMARVNAFLVLARTGKPANPKYTTDNDLLNSGHPRHSGKKNATKGAADHLLVGDYVNWSIGGQLGYGEIDEIVTEGMVSLPGADMSIEASLESPAAVICVYAPHGEDWEESGVYVAVKCSELTPSNPPIEAEEDEETEMSETEKDLVAEEVIETAAVDEMINVEKSLSEDIAPEAVEETLGVDAAAEEAAETVIELPAETVLPIVEVTVAAEEPVADVEEYREVSEADVAEVLASATSNRLALETGAPLQGEAEAPVAEPVAAEPVAEEVAVEAAPAEAAPNDAVIEELGAEPAPEDQGVEPVVEIREEAEKSADVDDISKLVTVAKSALDAAFRAQQEVELLRKENTELAVAKAKVEKDLEIAKNIIDRMSAEPVGRKLITKATEQRYSDATWLHPYIQRVLEAQD